MTSHFLTLLSKQPSRKKQKHFLPPNLLQKEVICQFYYIKKKKKSTPRHIVQTNVCFSAKHVENATYLKQKKASNWQAECSI